MPNKEKPNLRVINVWSAIADILNTRLCVNQYLFCVLSVKYLHYQTNYLQKILQM